MLQTMGIKWNITKDLEEQSKGWFRHQNKENSCGISPSLTLSFLGLCHGSVFWDLTKILSPRSCTRMQGPTEGAQGCRGCAVPQVGQFPLERQDMSWGQRHSRETGGGTGLLPAGAQLPLSSSLLFFFQQELEKRC